MTSSNIRFIGLDVHKESIEIAIAEDEAIRDLSGAREECVSTRTKAKQRLKSFLLRHDIRCPHNTNWNETHLRWLAEINYLTQLPKSLKA